MRLSAALAVLALSLGASPALAQSRLPMNAAILLGFEDGEGDAGLALRADLELVQRPIAPNVGLSLVGSLGYSRFSEEAGYAYFDEQFSLEATAGVFKIVPAVRLTFGNSAKFRPYVDAGIGLYYASVSVEQTYTYQAPYYPYPTITERFEDSTSETGLMFRLAGGLAFELSPGFSLGAELGLTPYFGDIDDEMFSLLLGAQFRM